MLALGICSPSRNRWRFYVGWVTNTMRLRLSSVPEDIPGTSLAHPMCSGSRLLEQPRPSEPIPKEATDVGFLKQAREDLEGTLAAFGSTSRSRSYDCAIADTASKSEWMT